MLFWIVLAVVIGALTLGGLVAERAKLQQGPG